jgi:hypothetical protein
VWLLVRGPAQGSVVSTLRDDLAAITVCHILPAENVATVYALVDALMPRIAQAITEAEDAARNGAVERLTRSYCCDACIVWQQPCYRMEP